ncbi:hypothetical protein MTO96_023978 [Rhipicephalus appendiculatus]
MDNPRVRNSDTEGTQQVASLAVRAFAQLPLLKTKWIAMMHNMLNARRDLASENTEGFVLIAQAMRSTRTLISEIVQSVSVVEREVRHLKAENGALRRDNARLLNKLARLRQEELPIRIPSGGPPPSCDEDSMAADSSTASATCDFPSGTSIEGGTIPADAPWGNESMAMDP